MFGISYREHRTNEYVWQQVYIIAGRHKLLLSTAKRRKLPWFDHVCRHDTLPKIILYEQWKGIVAEEDLVYHGRTKNGQWTGQSMSYCCASRMTEVDGQLLQPMHLSEPQRRLGVTGLISLIS